MGYFSSFPPHCFPSPPAPPCIKYFYSPSSLLASSFLGLLVVLLVLFGCFQVSSARVHTDTAACQKVSSFPFWEFLFGFVCRDLGLFFICLVYVAGFVVSDSSVPIVTDANQSSQTFVLSYLSHSYPLALTVALPSSRFFSHRARCPRDDELDRQVVTSGLKLQPIPLPLSHPRFQLVPYGMNPTHLRLWLYFLFSFLSAYPLSIFLTPLR